MLELPTPESWNRLSISNLAYLGKVGENGGKPHGHRHVVWTADTGYVRH